MLRFKQMIVITMLGMGFAGSHVVVIAQDSNLFGGLGQGAMAIDLKPDDPENIVRPSAGRVINVVIFGGDSLDVGVINPRTIRLNGVDVLLVGKSNKRLCIQTDTNDDNHLDLLCEVHTTGFKVKAGEYKVILKASTYQGETLKAEDRIKVVLD